MDRNASSFTVLFQPPFWVGVAERWDATGYSAARVVFGPEPTAPWLYEWLLREWHRLRFSPAVLGKTLPQGRKNPKRALREARAATQESGLPRARVPAPGLRRLSAASGNRREDSARFRVDRQSRRQRSGNTFCINKKSAKKSGAGKHLSRFCQHCLRELTAFLTAFLSALRSLTLAPPQSPGRVRPRNSPGCHTSR